MLKRQINPPPPHLFPPDEWRIIEARWSPGFWKRAETIFALSNGYIGTRGTYDEGRPTYAPGTYVNGFHETWPIRHAEDAYGLARTGQTIVNLPDATTIELFVDDEPLFLPMARFNDYSRVLDLRSGIVTRDLVWSTASGKHAHVRSERLVSLEHRHLVAVSYEVTLDRAAPVVLRSRVSTAVTEDAAYTGLGEALLDPRGARRLDRPALERVMSNGGKDRILLGYRTHNSGMTLGLGVAHVVDGDTEWELRTSDSGQGSPETNLIFDAQPGATIRLVKYLAIHSSRVAPVEDLVSRTVHTLDRAVRDGFEAPVAAQRRNLDRFWDRADVVVESNYEPVRVQQAIRWNLFQLAQASWRAEGAGIPAKGLTGDAYEGHYFWDSEVYVLPFLTYTQPRIARNLLRFRHSMLPEARLRAAKLGHPGATFPWRTINGEEASAQFQSGTAQYHINADIAHAIQRYVNVRGDVGFLAEIGAEMLIETARMWADLGFYDAQGCFHIHGVTGPDEYTTVVNDNAFTNLMARRNLRYAAHAVRLIRTERPAAYDALVYEQHLDPVEIAVWEHAADRMHIPYDDERGITPQDETFLDREHWDLANTPPEQFPLLLHHHPLVIYRHQVLKQADVVMAMFLLGDEFDLDQKRRNHEYYDPITTGDSSLSSSIQSIVASEVGNTKAASRDFDFSLLMDLADVAGNVSDGVHVASSAGVWMALVFGVGGVRDYEGQLSIHPHLPRRWKSLTFGLRFQGRQIRVCLGHDIDRFTVEEGDPLTVEISGHAHELVLDQPLELKRE